MKISTLSSVCRVRGGLQVTPSCDVALTLLTAFFQRIATNPPPQVSSTAQKGHYICFRL